MTVPTTEAPGALSPVEREVAARALYRAAGQLMWCAQAEPGATAKEGQELARRWSEQASEAAARLRAPVAPEVRYAESFYNGRVIQAEEAGALPGTAYDQFGKPYGHTWDAAFRKWVPRAPAPIEPGEGEAPTPVDPCLPGQGTTPPFAIPRDPNFRAPAIRPLSTDEAISERAWTAWGEMGDALAALTKPAPTGEPTTTPEHIK